ncbi:MAG: hypothetical protein WC466_02900 [Candidatus Izemoplasmatales bacterium]
MEKEISIKINVKSEDDYKRIEESIRVKLANMELGRVIEILKIEFNHQQKKNEK